MSSENSALVHITLSTLMSRNEKSALQKIFFQATSTVNCVALKFHPKNNFRSHINRVKTNTAVQCSVRLRHCGLMTAHSLSFTLTVSQKHLNSKANQTKEIIPGLPVKQGGQVVQILTFVNRCVELCGLSVNESKMQGSIKCWPYRGMYLLVFLHENPVTERGWAKQTKEKVTSPLTAILGSGGVKSPKTPDFHLLVLYHTFSRQSSLAGKTKKRYKGC